MLLPDGRTQSQSLCVKAWAFKQLLDYSEYLASLGAALLGVVHIGGRATPVRESCRAGTMSYDAAYDAARVWAAQRPWIQPERSFTECAQCSGAAGVCMEREHYGSVLACMGFTNTD